MIRQLRPVPTADFSEIIGDRHLVTASVGSDLSPVVLSLPQEPDYRTVTPSGASFAKKRASQPNQFAIHYLVGDDWLRSDLQETTENFHCLQPLGQEHWLLVRGRADGEADRNATVFDMDGRPKWSFHAGDGIQDVQTSEKSEVWISYFDEGVFGDSSLGQAGLVCLDQHGNVILRYNDGVGSPYISDCYALNVCSGKEVWLYYYTDFPLIQLLDYRLAGTWQDLPVAGSHSFAVGHDRILFCGGYNKRDRLFLVALPSMAVTEIELLDRLGQPLREFRGIGRRSVLHISTAETLYRLDVDEL